MEIIVTVNSDAAMAKLGTAGIPMQVRNNLRRVIPDIMREVRSSIDLKLDRLKSRTSLKTNALMREDPQGIHGTVDVTSSKLSFLPQILESGARPHTIEGNPILAFYWPKMGKTVFFRRVNHPGFEGIHYIQDTVQDMGSEIRERLIEAVRSGSAVV